MGIANFFNKQIVIRRYKTVSGNKKNYQATATVWGGIQQLDQNDRSVQDILESRAWLAWFEEDEDVQEGDRITDNITGTEYRVVQINKVDWGINRHLETLLEELNA